MSIADQTDLWAENARDHGAQAAAEASSEWMREAERWMKFWVRGSSSFTADDVRDKLGPPPSDGALGALFLNASKAGLIEVAGYTYSSRIVGHRRRIAVWRGRRGA